MEMKIVEEYRSNVEIIKSELK